MNKKYSCSSNLFASHSIETVLKQVSLIGCNYVDLWFSPPFCKHVDPFNDNPEELKKLVNSYGLDISALTIYFTTHEEKIKSLEFAAKLGISYIVMEPSPLDNFYDKMTNIDGEIDSLWAYGINKYQESDYFVDNITVNFKFSSGAIGCFYGNSSVTSYSPWERVEIYGYKSWLVIEDQYRVILFDQDHGPYKYWEPSMSNTTFFDEEFGGYVGEIKDFVDSVRDGKTPKASGWDGYKTLRIAEAIEFSIKNKREVNFSKKEGYNYP